MTLRVLAIEEGLGVVPQAEVHARGLVLHPDLVDPIAGVVLEAEWWEFHGKDERAVESDRERYTALVVTGWRVLRFTWGRGARPLLRAGVPGGALPRARRLSGHVRERGRRATRRTRRRAGTNRLGNGPARAA